MNVVFKHRLRVHSSSRPHSARMAGPLHRHVQAQAGRVLGIPGATEGPRLGERKHRKKKKNIKKYSHVAHLPISGPFHLVEFPGTFSQMAVARREERVPAWRETA